MANTVVITDLVDGPKTRVVHVSITYVDAQESDTVIYDFSADTAKPDNAVAGNGRVKKVWWANDTADVLLEWDGTTDFLVQHINPDSEGCNDYQDFGGIKDNSTAPTGDLTLTTVGLAAADHFWAIVVVDKY